MHSFKAQHIAESVLVSVSNLISCVSVKVKAKTVASGSLQSLVRGDRSYMLSIPSGADMSVVHNFWAA
jgi:hypothetical protein